MKTSVLQYSFPTLLAVVLSLPAAAYASSSVIDRARSCHVVESEPFEQLHISASKRPAVSDSGQTRIARLIYFLPNDRSFNPDVADTMKARIPRIQTFFSQQMQAHGHGNKTFQYETDDQGDPVVHRVAGSESESALLFSYRLVGLGNVIRDLGQDFDYRKSILFVVVDHSTAFLWDHVAGAAQQWKKNGGIALVPSNFSIATAAHELGHAFGLAHDFRDNAYMMSFGPTPDRLSACNAGFLAVHPNFNPDVPIEAGWAPTFELKSSLRYPAGSTIYTVQVNVASGGSGLHRVALFVRTRGEDAAAGLLEMKACRTMAGEEQAVVEFEYDGVIPSDSYANLANAVAHPIAVGAVDTLGNWSRVHYSLAMISPHHIATLEGHRPQRVGESVNASLSYDDFNCASISPDGTTLAAGFRTGIQLWDVATRTSLARLSQSSVSSVAFTPDGTTLASGSTRANEANIKLWNVENRTLIATLDGHQGGPTGVHSVAFSPSGDTLASGSGDETIKLWNVANQTLIATLEGHTSHVFSVAFSSDGTLASGSGDGTVKLWDVATRTNTATFGGNSGRVVDVAISPGGTRLASIVDGTVKLWDVATQTETAALEGGGGEVSFSRDGAVLAYGSGYGTVKVWDVETMETVATLGHPGRVSSPFSEFPVTAVAFSANGPNLASGGWNGSPVRIEIWNTSAWTGSSPVQAATDFNDDGKTDFVDFFLFADAYGGTDAKFDLDGNGTVDFADFFKFVDAFGS